MKKIILYLSLIILYQPIYSQNAKIDSLEKSLMNYTETDTVKIDLLNDLAFKQLRFDKEKALKYAMLADSLSDVIGYSQGKPKSLKIKGMYYKEMLDFRQAINYFQKSMKISEELNDLGTLASCNNELAQIYMNKGDYPHSLEYYHASLEICEKLGNEMYIAIVQLNLGNLYFKQHNHTEALHYFSESADFFEKSNNKSNLIISYKNITALYVELEKDSLALMYSEKLIALCKSEGNNYELAHALVSRGQIEESRKNYDLAKQYYIDGIRATDKTGDVFGSYVSNYSLAHLYVEIGKYNLALDYALVANEKANKLGRLKEKSDVAQMLSLIYKNRNEYKEAYQYLRLHKTFADSLLNKSNIKEITSLENKYQFDKEKEKIADEQAKKDAIQAEKLKQQKTVRNLLIIGFVLMIVFVVFIVRNLVQKRKANLLLAQQKEEIETQDEELKATNEKLIELDEFKQGMTGMIVHDLKNPLNSIINVSDMDSPKNQLIHTKQAGKQMLNMVLNILDVQKYEEQGIIVDKIPASIYEIAQRSINDVAFLAVRKNITIQNNIATDTWVKADIEIIERVFVNLLTNAIKFTPNNGTINLKGIKTTKDLINIEVTDTGEGIAQDKLHLVFSKFGQVLAKKSGGVRSTGLGLTFCKLAIEAHGQQIGVESEQGKGTTFWFTLETSDKQELKPQTVTEISYIKADNQFTPDEKQLLTPFVELLKKIEIYRMFDILQLLKKIEQDGSENITRWKQDIQNATSSGNKEKYNELLNF